MAVAGSILSLFLSTFGAIFLVLQFFTGEAGAHATLFLAMCMVSLQFIFGIISFFKGRAAGIAIISTALFVLIFAIATKAVIVVMFEVVMIGAGLLSFFGGRSPRT